MAKLRWEFEAGCLAMSEINHIANYGRSLGLDVEIFASGRLVKRGWIVASGDNETVARYKAVLEELEKQKA